MELSRYVYSGSIRSLFSILNAWTECLDKYPTYFKYGDNQWWYNERASLSCLAAASWTTGGIALEEFCTLKEKPPDSRNGRCDLFIGTATEAFAFEAKQVWCAVGCTAQSGVAVARKGLESACRDARKLTKEEGRRIGLCFAVPYLPARDEQHIEKQLMPWLKDSHDKIECSCVAWIFPEKAR